MRISRPRPPWRWVRNRRPRPRGRAFRRSLHRRTTTPSAPSEPRPEQHLLLFSLSRTPKNQAHRASLCTAGDHRPELRRRRGLSPFDHDATPAYESRPGRPVLLGPVKRRLKPDAFSARATPPRKAGFLRRRSRGMRGAISFFPPNVHRGSPPASSVVLSSGRFETIDDGCPAHWSTSLASCYAPVTVTRRSPPLAPASLASTDLRQLFLEATIPAAQRRIDNTIHRIIRTAQPSPAVWGARTADRTRWPTRQTRPSVIFSNGHSKRVLHTVQASPAGNRTPVSSTGPPRSRGATSRVDGPHPPAPRRRSPGCHGRAGPVPPRNRKHPLRRCVRRDHADPRRNIETRSAASAASAIPTQSLSAAPYFTPTRGLSVHYASAPSSSLTLFLQPSPAVWVPIRRHWFRATYQLCAPARRVHAEFASLRTDPGISAEES